jgi:hypothetical protein
VGQLLIHPHNQRHRKGDKRKGDKRKGDKRKGDKRKGDKRKGDKQRLRGFSAKRMPTRSSFYVIFGNIKQLENADAMDKDKLEQLKLRLEDSVEAIDVHQEAQELVKLFPHSEVFTVNINPQPCFQDFADRVRSARWRNVPVLHLTGHGGSKCVFFWLKNPAVSTTEYDHEIPVDRFANILSQRVGGGEGKGTLECVVLNACETETMGKTLRSVGLLHVVCWRSVVQDTTAKSFALDFYASLKDQGQARDYKFAFQQAVVRMSGGGGKLGKCKTKQVPSQGSCGLRVLAQPGWRPVSRHRTHSLDEKESHRRRKGD